jgi:hypothetical protein
VAKLVKGRYPDLLELLLYLKKLLDEETKNKLVLTENSQFDLSQQQSPNRYTMRNSNNVANENLIRQSMQETKMAVFKPKTELEKKHKELE